MNGYGTHYIATLKNSLIALSLAITIFNLWMLLQVNQSAKDVKSATTLQGQFETLSKNSTNLAQQVDRLSNNSTNLAQQVNGLSADSANLARQVSQLSADSANLVQQIANSFEFAVQASPLGEPRHEATVGCGNDGVLVGGSCIGFTTGTQVAVGPVFYDPLQVADGKPISTIRCLPYTSEAGMRVRAFAVCMRQKR